MAFKMKGYSAYDKVDSAYNQNSPMKNYKNPEKYKVFNMGNEPKGFKQTDNEKKEIQIEKKPTIPNLSEKLKEMGVTEEQVMDWAHKNIEWFESGDWGDQYDDNDILKWGRLLSKDLYEGNVDEID